MRSAPTTPAVKPAGKTAATSITSSNRCSNDTRATRPNRPPRVESNLVPTHASLDCVHNDPTESAPANAATDIKLVRQSNGVHPATSGYHQIGGTPFAWLKSQTKE